MRVRIPCCLPFLSVISDMEKILREVQHNGGGPDLVFWCPGCKCGHGVWTTGERKRWSFNGDMEKPTFDPSVLIERKPRCHLHVRNGEIHFLPDCEHELKGRIVPMEKF